MTYWVDAAGRMSGFAGTVVKDNPVATNRLATDDHTLRHELSHVYGPAVVPTWVDEGLAEYLSGCESNICGEDGPIDYAVSHAAVSWLIDENGGLERFLEFCNDFYLHLPSGSDDFHDGTGKALRASYGITQEQLVEGAWAWFERLPSD